MGEKFCLPLGLDVFICEMDPISLTIDWLLYQKDSNKRSQGWSGRRYRNRLEVSGGAGLGKRVLPHLPVGSWYSLAACSSAFTLGSCTPWDPEAGCEDEPDDDKEGKPWER